ncbi:MAG: ubiquitin-like domain-containing protein [Chloroflexota bacterium]|nr:ubiquitin-like domain-containing protein [Chloroflexota bacterium]
MGRTHVLPVLLRLGRLALVTSVVGMGTWALLGPTPFVSSGAVAARRAAPAARGVLGVESAPLTVSVDGLAANVRISSGTVADALSGLGIAAGSQDRLSAPGQAAVIPGQRLALDRGLPVTLIDGGREIAARSVRGTVADVLAAAGIALGPLDQVDRPLGANLYPGDVIRVTRISDHRVAVQQEVPFAVHLQPDPNLARPSQVVVTPGALGRVQSIYVVRTVDGRETSRALVESQQLAEPVTEVRRIGTRTPTGSAEIEAIIREAAAAQGADPEQLLRVAYCESRFNPGAYNASGASGLFQFMPRTWAANSVRAGFAGASVFDPLASANVAAWMFARGQAFQWVCR